MFDRFRQFVREARSELKRVNWPSREQMKSFTSVVLVALLILGVFLWLVDLIVHFVFEWTVYRRGGGASATAGQRVIAMGWGSGLKPALFCAADWIC